MLKVSFKGDFKKTEVFNDKATIVTLKGIIKLPKYFLCAIPESILDWAYRHPTVEFHDSIDSAYIIVKGKSVCAEGDTFNTLKGERIAESRAKIRLYKFMATFTDKLCSYYYALVFGKTGEAVSNLTSYGDSTSLRNDNRKYHKLLITETEHFNKLLHS